VENVDIVDNFNSENCLQLKKGKET